MAQESWLKKLVVEKLENMRRRIYPLLPHRAGVAGTAPQQAGSVPDGSQQSVTDRLETMKRQFEQATIRLGLIGESGSGKSSLINAIVGQEIAPVGALIETTRQAQEVHVDGLTLVDLPGCGTPNWPRESYIDRLKLLDAYDGFILVTANRLKECDAMLFTKLSKEAKKPFFVVRSHFDLAVAAKGEREARGVIAPHIRQQLGADAKFPIYMVASPEPELYDLEQLILDIRRSLPEWKQVRFTMAAHAYGEQTLREKRQATEKIVGIHAGLAAANSLNPIPGLDVGVDLGLLTTMSRYVISTYGLAPSQVEALKTQANMRAAVVKGIHEIADRVAPYLTERFLLMTLRSMGVEVLVANSAKWVPFVGTLISAGVGYKLTYSFGEKLINECEAAAEEIIATVTHEVCRPRPV
jgi:small GTP-binding protein